MKTHLADQSNDRIYRVETPQIVWALCDDVYELALWTVVKMIAGEKGECYLATEDLANAAMMSVGKASQCRKNLIEKGLLQGEIRRDPGYPQPVWHLTIPDLWPINIKWRQDNDSLKERIAAKCKGRSLHQVKPSPGEGGPSPGEGGPSPGETKKEPIEQPKRGSQLDAQPPSEVSQAAPHNKYDSLVQQDEQETAMEIAEVMTVDEIKSLDLTERQWQLLYEAEKTCKDRVTAKRHIRRQLADNHPPSVDIYRELAEMFPKKSLWPIIDETIGRDETDLAFWRKVVEAWLLTPWSDRNIKGMIEHFERREIPSTNGSNASGKESELYAEIDFGGDHG